MLSSRRFSSHQIMLLLTIFFSAVLVLQAQEAEAPLLKDMRWRSIGPANFAGRISDVEALDTDFRVVYVAAASGGVWKSTNAGTTWQPIFDNYGSASIGDIALFQNDPNIVWVGTGEANNRNSVAWGDGIYKSTDAGKTFHNMGLRNTYQIARVVTHPTNPAIVYVAAIGNLWGFSGDRGLFKTEDGGAAWTKLTNGLPNDGKTGATDLVIDPTNPNILYVAFYERLRKPYRFDSGGESGGIFKSIDGGTTWKKLVNGLPSGATGRIGLDIARNNPAVLMTIIEHGFQPNENDPDYNNMQKLGTGIYRSENGGEQWSFVNRYNNRPFYYSQIRMNPHNDKNIYVLTTTIRISNDGGKTLRVGENEFEGGLDFHALWFDPLTSGRYYLGKDKGLTLTHDGGATFILYDNMPIGQYYAIGVDMRDPYHIYGGTQDNGSWGGPHFSRDARGILNDSWWKLHWGDGMFAQVDPTDWRKVYTEAENGSARLLDAKTRQIRMAVPSPRTITNYQEYITEQSNRARFRFNWRAPLVMSLHNPLTLYLGGNHLFKSVDGMKTWQIISPDLSTNDPLKTDTLTGGLTSDRSGAETHCSITAIAESPLSPRTIWVGTDDGNIQLTRNGGGSWINVRSSIRGVPEGIWVSSIEASHFEEGVCYVTFDGHRSDDFSAWIFKTTDFGKSWTNITANIPHGQSIYVIREDLKQRNLLFAGSEFGCFVSLNGGKRWARLMNGMPTVAIHDLVIHPRDGDLIAATHGRSLYVLDDCSPLRQWSDTLLTASAHLFEQRPAVLWEDATRGGARGHFYFAGDNPPSITRREDVVRAKLESGALITYYLKEKPRSKTILEITDVAGQSKRSLEVPTEPGINRILWDLRFDPTQQQLRQTSRQLQMMIERVGQSSTLSSGQQQWLKKTAQRLGGTMTRELLLNIREEFATQFRGSFGGRGFFSQAFQGPEATPDLYLLTLTVDGKSYRSTLRVRRDPILEEGE